jgi:hypothetical protein
MNIENTLQARSTFGRQRTLEPTFKAQPRVYINKVSITEEAVFDYEHCLLNKSTPTWSEILKRAGGCAKRAWDLSEQYEQPVITLDKKRLKAELEEYITRMNDAGKLLNTQHFRCLITDDNFSEPLMLFLHKREKMSLMQLWELVGISKADDWDEELEDDGIIRKWLKPFETDMPKGDWVAEQQVRAEIDKQNGLSAIQGNLNGLPKELKYAIEHGDDKELAKALSILQTSGGEWDWRGGVERKDVLCRKINLCPKRGRI